MLNCKISHPISGACDTNVSGVRRVAFANYSENYKFTASADGCEIDTIDLGEGEKVYEVNIMDNTGVATATLTVGANNDSKYFQHSVGGTIAKLDCELLNDYKNWALAHLIAFVQTKNGDVFVFGADNGLAATTFEYTTGTAEGDATGVAFVLEGAQKNAPLKVKDWSVVKALMDGNAKPGAGD